MPSMDPWAGVNVDLLALHDIVSQVFKVPKSQCGPGVEIGTQQVAMYARVYSFELSEQTVVARVVAPVKPLFKTESEIAAMDYVRSHTSLPVPEVFMYCSEADNPVGAEWILMQYMSGVQMDDAWYDLDLPKKQRLALGIVCLYDQLFKLRADACGAVYHIVNSVDDKHASCVRKHRTPRWKPLSLRSLKLLRKHCAHPLNSDDRFSIGPLHDISLLNYRHADVPSHSHTPPTLTHQEYFKLVAFNGNPSTRAGEDSHFRKRCVELFQRIQRLHDPQHSDLNSSQFHFSHGDLHDANILIDPETGAITAILDWESAGFRPAWVDINGIGWFEEDAQRFIIGDKTPENFEFDTEPGDAELRAFFRVEMYRRNPELFECFFGGVEMRAVLQAATDDPQPVGKTDIFLKRYFGEGFWNEGRRGVYHDSGVDTMHDV